ncbi:MAG: hypothetical protein HQM01_13310, partial [Magnetococcales bacterium]|nr:hypothetical protein [Magnetococcales bacterium]
MDAQQKSRPAGKPDGSKPWTRDDFTAPGRPGQGLDADRVRSAAQGHWREILTNLGMDPTYLTNKHGPCPFCGGRDRWRWDDRDGNGSGICSQCGPGDGFHLAGKLLRLDPKADFGEILRRVADVLGVEPGRTRDPRPPRSAPRPEPRHDEPPSWMDDVPPPDACDAPGGEESRPGNESPRHDPATIWASCGPAPDDHPYLIKKGVQAHGLRLYRGGATIARTPLDGALVVPLCGLDGRLQTIQFITEAGAKLLLPGHPKKGAFFTIGEPTGTVCLSEGFATGASVHEATGHQTIVAIDAGNLRPV